MTADIKLSRYVVFSRIFQIESGEVYQVLFSTYTRSWYLIDPLTARKLQRNEFDNIPNALLDLLYYDEIIVPVNTDELSKLLCQNASEYDSSESYIVTMMPSSFCQMGCSYCGQRHSKSFMDATVLSSTIKFIREQFSARRYSSMNVSWFGGEPLTGIGVIRKVTPHLRAICDEQGAKYRGHIITNGILLTRQVIQELHYELGISSIQVTLDGPKDIHDSRRYLAQGGGTYTTIMHNLEEYAADPIQDIQIGIRTNVDVSNVESLFDLLNDLVQTGILKVVSSFDIASVFDWGGDHSHAPVSQAEFAAIELEFRRQLLSLGHQTDLIPKRTSHICPTYYDESAPLIDTKGNLHSCYENPIARDSDSKQLARNGSVFSGIDGSKDRRRKQLNDLLMDARSNPDDCVNCEMLPICGGICEPYRNTGRRYCPPFKHNLGERLIHQYYISSKLQA